MRATRVAEAAGISNRQLDYWCRVGYLVACNNGRGSGISRDFTDIEVSVAIAMGELIDLGFHLDAAAAVAREFQTQPEIRSRTGRYVLSRVQDTEATP